MKTQLIETTSKLLPTAPQLRVEPPARVEQMAHPGDNAGNARVVVELALTIRLHVQDSSISRRSATVNVGIRVD